MLLENPGERVALLKAGISGKKIEEMYISLNDFRIVGNVQYEKSMDCDHNNRSDLRIPYLSV